MLASATNWLFRYPAGTALAAWRYLWRPLPLQFVDADVTDVAMPPVPLGAPDIQRAEEGTGPLFHRRYRIRLRHSPLGPAELMRAVVDDLQSLSPREVAAFHRQSGRPGALEVGDDYVVRLPGPWDGPVRVAARTPTCFLLATRRGHPEAGVIRFRAGRLGDDLGFEIESWARSSGRRTDLLYDRLGLSLVMQTHVWATFCERVAKLAEGRPVGGVLVYTGRSTTG